MSERIPVLEQPFDRALLFEDYVCFVRIVPEAGGFREAGEFG
jgi:hypothetical protein